MSDLHQCYLEILTPTGRPSRFLLGTEPVVIGRGDEASVRLESKDVSRRHAELAVNDLGQWSIRDLRSRNGTTVNGQRLEASEMAINWLLLEPGDRIEIAGFVLTLMIGSPALEAAMGHEVSYVNVDLSEGGDQPVRSLEHAEAARIEPAQLLAVGSLALQLMQIGNPVKRLESLCRFMLRAEMGGLAATALRLHKDPPTAKPSAFFEPIYHESWPADTKLHISRTALRAVLGSGQPVLAGASPTGAAIEMSVKGPAAEQAVIACPLLSSERVTDLLYVAFKPEHGTTDWLALVALAARQFQTAEVALRRSPTPPPPPEAGR